MQARGLKMLCAYPADVSSNGEGKKKGGGGGRWAAALVRGRGAASKYGIRKSTAASS